MRQLFRRILVPHDLSAHADRALRVAADLARAARGRLVVLHVLAPYPLTGLTPLEGVPMVTPADLVTPSRKRLVERVGRVLGRRAASADVRVVVGDPASEIVRTAGRAGSIVMSTEGRTGLSHLLIGSVAEKVVRHAACPVLTLRGARTRRRRA
jgi:nucleotide-binding universal stress UspA family protein